MQQATSLPVDRPLNPAVLRTLQEVRRGQLTEGSRVALAEIWQGASVSPQVVLKDLEKLQQAGVLVDASIQGATIARGAGDKALEFERALFLATEWPGIRSRLEELGLTSALLAR